MMAATEADASPAEMISEAGDESPALPGAIIGGGRRLALSATCFVNVAIANAQSAGHEGRMTSGSKAQAIKGQHWAVEVNRADLGESRTSTKAGQPLAQGEISVVVDKLAISANNITYAPRRTLRLPGPVANHAPLGAGYPLGGYSHVGRSISGGLPVGTRLYGLFPTATPAHYPSAG